MLITEFDKRSSFELSLFGHKKWSRFQFVKIRHDQHQIRSLFDRKEPRSWNINTNGILEIFNSCTRSSFQLNNICSYYKRQNIIINNRNSMKLYFVEFTVWESFFIDNDFHVFNFAIFTKSINGVKSKPQVVSVENLEFWNWFEFIYVFFWNLSDFKKSGTAFIFNQGTTLIKYNSRIWLFRSQIWSQKRSK